jgi:integrase/recombinase XerD
MTVYSNGEKTRQVLLSAVMWQELMRLDGHTGYVYKFRSKARSKGLSIGQVERIVRKAARDAGIELTVSPHWMRHAHASHSLDRGAPISLVSETLDHASIATTGRYTHARPNASSSQFLPF